MHCYKLDNDTLIKNKIKPLNFQMHCFICVLCIILYIWYNFQICRAGRRYCVRPKIMPNLNSNAKKYTYYNNFFKNNVPQDFRITLV